MNLIVDPWIPAVRPDGTRALFSLREIFRQADTLRDLSVRPHERIALMRLLICITQAALDGPEDQDALENCGDQIQPAVEKYLRKWEAGFKLYDEKQPFLQVPDLVPGKEKTEANPLTKLDLALATGNNTTLFDNMAGDIRLVTSQRAALNLLTFQCFSPGGRIGVARWNGHETPGNGSSNHAPCLPSAMLHALVIGDHLLSTIYRNLLSRQQVVDAFGFNKWGVPIWEQPVLNLNDEAAVQNASGTYLGRLVPMSRAIRIHPDGHSMILANGLNYPIFPAFREPTATVIRRKDELALLPTSTGRSIWRQLSAVTVKRVAATDSVSGPLAMANVDQSRDCTLWAGALVTEKAKIEDLVESVYSVPGTLFTEIGRAAYEKAVQYAEAAESAAIQAVKIYSVSLNVASPGYDRARSAFWTLVEQNLSALFEVARVQIPPAQLPGCGWGRSVHAAAVQAYEHACPRQTPRQIQAYAAGLRRLHAHFASTKHNV